MKIIDGIARRFGYEQRSLAYPSPELLALFGASPTAAGVSVTAETALRSPALLACVRVIAETLGAIPFHVYRRGPNGSRERDGAHPASRLLASDWSPWAGGVETRTAIQLDALLHGVGYGLLARVGGAVREIHRIDPRSVVADLEGAEPAFRVRSGDGERVVGWRDVLAIRTPGATVDRPFCILDAAREAIGVDLCMAEHQGKLFGNGARPSGMLKLPDKLSPDALERLKVSWNAAHGGGGNSGRTAVLEAGVSFEQMQFSSTDSQFLELRRFAIQEIARAFKVPSTLVGDLERATWRNVEELNRQFVTMTLLPWAEVWQSALERVLLTPDERQEYFVEAVFDDLLRGDIATRFGAYRQASGGAWLTPNEIRGLDNRPPIEGGDELIRQAGQGGAADPANNTTEGAPDGA